MQENLYRKCINVENIKKAIKEINIHQGSRTAGPDGISIFTGVKETEIIRQVKLRLRRYKRVSSRQVEIPKKDGKRRTLTILNLYDRYAQQAVYRVIAPIVESKMSKHSYGFRKGISAKIPASKIASCILNNENVWTVEIDFEKCFDNISLDKAIGKLKELGIKDSRLLRTIKHLMFISKEYSGVGLGQGTILGPLLCNCYLDKLDKYMESEYELEKVQYNKSRDYKRNKDTWLKWLKDKKKKIHCRYYRFADDTIILASTEEEREYIWNKLMVFIETELDLKVNLAKSKKRRNKTDFLGFHYIKNVGKLWIKVKDEREIYEAAKQKIGKGSVGEVLEFKKYLLGILNYFDITNEIGRLLGKIELKLYILSQRGLIKRLEENGKYKYRTNSCEVDLWGLRRRTRLSYKEYLIRNVWIKEREKLIIDHPCERQWAKYKWYLYTIQKGMDAITGKLLKAEECEIHHIIPRSKSGSDEPENLILISEDTHHKLHEGKELPKKAEKYRKHLSA